jgi:transposase
MKRILKREYTAEFREQAVAMVNNGKSVPEVAEELGLIEQTLRNWVKLAERGRLNEKAKKVTGEQMELSRLRAENAQLKMENEILICECRVSGQARRIRHALLHESQGQLLGQRAHRELLQQS